MRLIDADVLNTSILEAGQANKGGRYKIGDFWELNYAEIKEVIDSQPTVYAAPVIRCHNCRFYRPINGEIGECCHTKGTQWYVSRDGYCDRGEEKE